MEIGYCAVDLRMEIVNVAALTQLLITVHPDHNNAAPVRNGEQRIVFRINKTNHTYKLVCFTLGCHVLSVGQLMCCQRASPRSFGFCSPFKKFGTS